MTPARLKELRAEAMSWPFLASDVDEVFDEVERLRTALAEAKHLLSEAPGLADEFKTIAERQRARIAELEKAGDVMADELQHHGVMEGSAFGLAMEAWRKLRGEAK